jgi:hypothetical protein
MDYSKALLQIEIIKVTLRLPETFHFFREKHND